MIWAMGSACDVVVVCVIVRMFLRSKQRTTSNRRHSNIQTFILYLFNCGTLAFMLIYYAVYFGLFAIIFVFI